jgi:pyruvate,water dikinase
MPLSAALDEPVVGGKARNLGRLMAARIDVPAGVVITDHSFQQFLADADLLPAIDGLCAKLNVRRVAGVRAAADTIAALVRDASLPLALDGILDDAVAALGEGTLIVRSSAAGEDSCAASFAGQLDSIAGVEGPHLLRQAIRDVWASRWSARALAYQLARGVRLAGMGVIVQRQIAPRISGVLFTEDPASPGRMLVEYCAGSSEALVSGRENPGRLVVERDGSAPEFLAHPAERDCARMTGREIATLAAIGLRIERGFGGPQDIEWSIDDGGRVWIVQSRPITVATRSAATRDEQIHWSNANVNENFPRPVSPLLYSIARDGYYHYFRNLGRAFGVSPSRIRLMERPLREIVGVHAGRMYYNLSSIHGVLRSAPFGDLLASSFNGFVGADDTPAPAAAGRFRTRGRLLTQAAELAVIAVKTTWQYAFVTRRVRRFERVASDFAADTHPATLRNRTLGELAGDLRRFVDIRNNRWTDAALADAASMVCYGVLQRLLQRAMPSRDQATLQNSLLKALPGLVSSGPAVALWNLSRQVRSDARLRTLFESSSADVLAAIDADPAFAGFHAAFREYIEEWGFRCSGELMLTVPSFQEKPEEVVDLVRTCAALDSESPADLLVRQAEERRRSTADVAAAIKRRRRLRIPLLHAWTAISIVLRWTQNAILLRERARLKQALLYSRLRHVALAIGTRLVEAGHVDRPDDAFFLTAEELDSLASGTAMFPGIVRDLVTLRRAAHERYQTMAPPDSMTLGRGEYWELQFAARTSRVEASAGLSVDRAATSGDQPLAGVGACGGSTTARAAILSDISEAHRLVPGDVLVTKQTDPGWGPLFPLVSGLVIERGGMLSHGAIIAREFGIPSVVGVADATRRIPHGSRVAVDGDRGLVRILAGAEV